MCVRNLIGCMLVLTLLLLPALVGCQPANNSAAIDDVNKNLNKVLGKIQDLEEAAKGWPVVKKDVDDLGVKVVAVEKRLQANVDAAYNQSVVGGQLAKKVEQEIPEQLRNSKPLWQRPTSDWPKRRPPLPWLLTLTSGSTSLKKT